MQRQHIMARESRKTLEGLAAPSASRFCTVIKLSADGLKEVKRDDGAGT